MAQAIERSLLLVFPPVMTAGHGNAIVERLVRAHFTVIEQRHVRLTPEVVETLLSRQDASVASSTSLACVVAKPNAVHDLLALVGSPDSVEKESLYALYGTSLGPNAFHASATPQDATREISLLFPHQLLEPIPVGEAAEAYLEKTVNPTLNRALVELARVKPADPLRYLAHWLLDHNPNKPKVTEPGVHHPDIVFVLGGPGSGKGTQCQCLVDDLGFDHISAGDCLREEMNRPGSEYGEMISTMIRDGEIVPHRVTISLLKKKLEASEAKVVLIDGFPRATDQAEAFEEQVYPCRFVLFFDCHDETLVERLLKRGKTSGRSDDNEESIRKRLDTYASQTMPVIHSYEARGKVRRVDASATIEEVYARVKVLFD